MTADTVTQCAGCAQSQRRFRSVMPRLWCLRWHMPATARCIDFRAKRSALAPAPKVA